MLAIGCRIADAVLFKVKRFKVKRIQVKTGESISRQMHHHRAEHWIVVKGTAEVTWGEQTILLTENLSTYITIGHFHRRYAAHAAAASRHHGRRDQPIFSDQFRP